MRARRVLLSRWAIASIAATFLLMGIVVSAYGPLLEHLTRRFGVSLPVAGATISVHFAGSMPGVLAAMWAINRIAARALVVVAGAIVAAGMAVIAIAFAWPVFLAGVFVVGLGFGALVLCLNQLVAYSEGRRRAALLNALNGCYSAGAVAGPILVAAFAQGHFAALYLVGAVVWLALTPGALGISGRLPTSEGTPARPDALILIFIAAFVLYVAVENGTGGWMTSHLEFTGVPSGRAAALTSAFWLALVTGRLLITFVPSRVSEAQIVLAGAILGAVAIGLATIPAIAPAGYILAGFVIAPIFPTGIVWLARLRPGDSRATAWLFPAASIGGTIGPGLIGIVIAGAGVAWAPAVIALVALGMFGAFFIASRR